MLTSGSRSQQTLLSSFIKEMMQRPRLVLLFHGSLLLPNVRETVGERVGKNMPPIIPILDRNISETGDTTASFTLQYGAF
jgi:hypothetical protein